MTDPQTTNIQENGTQEKNLVKRRAKHIANALSIAGSDPSGGAGIQADLKSFAANHVYGMSVVTALTAQNTRGVTGIHLAPITFITAQIDAIFDDIRVDAVKIGMAATAETAIAIATALRGKPISNIVLDPVMVAKGGAPLLEPDAVDAVRRHLLPLATVLTPNLPEAATLLGQSEAQSRDAMKAQGLALLAYGPQAVFIKGGHFSAGGCPDLLVTATSCEWFEAERIDTLNTHGTGCSLSSALAAGLANGKSVEAAAYQAKAYVTGAIAAASQLDVGSGHGPLHHFHALWNEINKRNLEGKNDA